MAKPLILIGDPGHDDAIAWLLINTAREYDIKAVISASGNQTIEKTTYNSGRICALLGIDAPRAQGLKAPLCGELITAGNFHGESGLDGPVLPEPITSVSDMSGADLMKKIIDESSEKVTILSTGPQTDVADLIMKYPDVKEKIQPSGTDLGNRIIDLSDPFHIFCVYKSLFGNVQTAHCNI